MLEIILYIAVSADGFIADQNGGIDWLDKYNTEIEDVGYHNFYSSIDALVFGQNTYNQVRAFTPWPYAGKMSYVFATKDTLPINNDIEIIDTDIPTFIKKVKATKIKRLWLMGGAKLVDSFDKLNLIDEYILTILRDRLIQGIALPEQIFHGKNAQLIDTINYPHLGIVQKYYKKIA